MPSLASVENCTGCAACYNICPHSAINMSFDEEGFQIPIINESNCIECKLCEKICPINNIQEEVKEDFPIKVYAIWSEKDRRISSSGGAFSAFARVILSENGVVFGATLDQNLSCKHIEIQDIKDLNLLRGSKYIQSEINDTFKCIKQYLNNNRKVLFCGTPCQVDGLKRFLRKPNKNLFTLDLICHGVPSNLIFKSYIKKISYKYKISNIENFSFRDLKGWGKSSYITKPKTIPLYNTKALFMEAFNKSAIFRKSCYKCQYSKKQRVGECTLGDFWGIGKYGKPFNYNTMNGVSLVIVNNQKGAELLKRIKNCFIEERSLSEALIENHNLKYPSVMPNNRDNIIKDFINPNIELNDINHKHNIVDNSIKAKIRNISYKLGIFSITKRLYNWYKSINNKNE